MIQKIHFGKRIAQYRKREKWSQAELAEKLGVTSQAVSKWECGTALPDVDLLLELGLVVLFHTVSSRFGFLPVYVPEKKNVPLSFPREGHTFYASFFGPFQWSHQGRRVQFSQSGLRATHTARP